MTESTLIPQTDSDEITDAELARVCGGDGMADAHPGLTPAELRALDEVFYSHRR